MKDALWDAYQTYGKVSIPNLHLRKSADVHYRVIRMTLRGAGGVENVKCSLGKEVQASKKDKKWKKKNL